MTRAWHALTPLQPPPVPNRSSRSLGMQFAYQRQDRRHCPHRGRGTACRQGSRGVAARRDRAADRAHGRRRAAGEGDLSGAAVIGLRNASSRSCSTIEFRSDWRAPPPERNLHEGAQQASQRHPGRCRLHRPADPRPRRVQVGQPVRDREGWRPGRGDRLLSRMASPTQPALLAALPELRGKDTALLVCTAAVPRGRADRAA